VLADIRRMTGADNNVLHLTAIPLRSIAAGELGRSEEDTKMAKKHGKYCVVCEKHWDPNKVSCCTPSSLVDTLTTGWLRERVAFLGKDGAELDEAGLGELAKRERNPKKLYPGPAERLKFLREFRGEEEEADFSVDKELADVAKEHPAFLDEVAVALAERVFRVEGSRVSFSGRSARSLAELGTGANAAVPLLAKILLIEKPDYYDPRTKKISSSSSLPQFLAEIIGHAQEAARRALEAIATAEAKLALSSPHECIYMQPRSSPSARMGTCDICCESTIPQPGGYVLTTRQVVEAHRFWTDYYERNSSKFRGMGINSYREFVIHASVRDTTVRFMTGQENPWLVCDRCVELFDVDKAKASEYALRCWRSGGNFTPEGSGPVPRESAALEE